MRRAPPFIRQNRPAPLKALIPLLVLSALLAGTAPPARSAVLSQAVSDAGGTPAPARFRVVVVDNLTFDQLRSLAPRAAVGLLVPGQGASTNRQIALESLAHGLNLNAAVLHPQLGRSLIDVDHGAAGTPVGNTIVLSLPRGAALQPNDRRYPIAVIGDGFHGLLTSPMTRIPGLVSIRDVAPTALGRARGSLGHVAAPAAFAHLAQLNARIHANNRIKLPVLFVIAGALLLIAMVRPAAAVPSVLASLLTSLVAGAASIASEPLLIGMILVGTILGGLLIAGFCSTDRRLLTAIVVVLGTYAVLLAARPEWIAISPLGPTQNSRFWGIGNQVETLMLAPVVLGASLAARRFGLIGFGAFALFVLVLVTDNRLGSDGGGAIVFGVALAFVGARSKRLGVRGFAILLGLAAAAVLAVIQLNLQSPGPDHLRSAFSRGLSGIVAVFADRVPLAYLPALRQWPMFVSLATAFVIVLVVGLRKSDRHARELVLAAALAVVTSLLTNDSAIYEVTAGVAVLAAFARFKTPVAPLVLTVPARSQLRPQPVANDD